MSNINSMIGAMLIVAGTSIGAGMLALPISTYSMGFLPSTILMIVMWCIALYSSLIIAKINAYFGKAISIPLAAKKILGKKIEVIASIAMLIMLYSLLVAYISGGASIVREELQKIEIYLPNKLISILLTLILALIVSYKIRAVDYVNRLMFLGKLIVFAVVIVFLADDINISYLSNIGGYSSSVFSAVVLFFTAFGFHLSIHAIVCYVGTSYALLRRVFILGTLVPLLIYIVWQATTLGIIPLIGDNSFSSVSDSGCSLGTFIKALKYHAGNVSLVPFVSWFSLLAILTSLLGVAIGLFEYFIELKKYSHNFQGRIKASLWTFILPLILVLISPNIFIKALTIAGAFLSFLAIIIPALIVLKLAKIDKQGYRKLFASRLHIFAMLFIGVVIVVMSFL